MALTTLSTLKNDKLIRDVFKARDPEFRIEAVIHDGQWYTLDKWASVAKVKRDFLESYIDNIPYLIRGKESYRVNADEIIAWYKKHNLNIETPLVPNNFTPKIWHGKTETQWIVETPRNIISSLSISLKDKSVEDKVISIIDGFGYKSSIYDKRYLIYTMNTMYLKNKLMNELSDKDYESLRLKVRNNYYRRFLTDFPVIFVEEFMNFYYNYAYGALKNHLETMRIYLHGNNEIKAQIQDWIITALSKYDEKSCVPFSGYLSTVLQRWPYDLPDIYLGKELALFQRKLSRARNYLIENRKDVTDEALIEHMEIYDKDKFYNLLNDHENFLKLKMIDTMTWDDKDSEKLGRSLTNSDPTEYSAKVSSNMSIALLKSVLETEDYFSFSDILNHYGNLDNDYSKLSVSDNFKKVFGEKLNVRS